MKPCIVYAGTADGVFSLTFDGSDWLEQLGRGAEGNDVRAIAVDPQSPGTAYVGCGLRGWGLYRTGDAGRSFERLGFEDRWVWEVTLAPHGPETIYVGTEPPALYRSRDGGRSFERLSGIEQLSSRPSWEFFYPPFEAGHIHGLAIHPERPERIFAGVEVGALIHSEDGGRSWREALVGHDVHRVAVDPLDPDRVLAGTGEGLYVSPDAGRRWEAVQDFDGRYVHGVQYSPHDPTTAYVQVMEDGKPLYRGVDGRRSWEPLGGELPKARSADSLALHPSEPEVLFYGGETTEGRSHVFASSDGGASWSRLLPELSRIFRLRAGSQP